MIPVRGSKNFFSTFGQPPTYLIVKSCGRTGKLKPARRALDDRAVAVLGEDALRRLRAQVLQERARLGLCFDFVVTAIGFSIRIVAFGITNCTF